MTLHLQSTSQLKRIVLTEGGAERKQCALLFCGSIPPSPALHKSQLWLPEQQSLGVSVSAMAGAHWRQQAFCAPDLSVPARVSAQPEDGWGPRPRCLRGCSSSIRCSGTGACPVLAKWEVLKGCYSLKCRLLWCEFILKTGSCWDPALAASSPYCESEWESLSDSWLCLKNKWQVSNIFPFMGNNCLWDTCAEMRCTRPGQSCSSFL